MADETFPYKVTGDPSIDFEGYREGPLAPEVSWNVFRSPQGFHGPGILSNIGALVGNKVFGSGETPESVYRATTPLQETALNTATLALPTAPTFLGRMAVQGALQGAESALAGKPTPSAITDAAKAAALQGGVEGAFGLLGRLPTMARAARTAMAQYGADVATEQAGRVDQAAGKIADFFKQRVPAWRDLPSDSKGLTEMVYGRGQELASQAFDDSLREIVKSAKGQMIALRPEDIKALRLKGDSSFLANLTGPAREVLARAGKLPPAAAEGLVNADAAQVAEAVVGKGTKMPDVYRRVVAALDRAGLGDPAARAAYSASQGLIQFVDKTKALEGEVLRPDRLLAGLTQLKKLNELRRRGLGTIFAGPIQESAREAMLPSTIPAPDIRTLTLPGPGPSQQRGLTLGTAGGILGALAGHGSPWHWGAPGVAGYLAGRTVPKEIVTRAPLDPDVAAKLADMPNVIGTILRSLGFAGAPEPSGPLRPPIVEAGQ